MQGWLYLLGYILFLGVGTFLQKISLKNLSPYQLHILISIGMFLVGIPAFLYFQKAPQIPNKGIFMGLGVGILFATGSLMFTLALSKLPAGTATVVSLAYVAIVLGLSVIFLHEQLSVAKLLGIVLTILGMALIYK